MKPSGISRQKTIGQIVFLINRSENKEEIAADYAYDVMVNSGRYVEEEIDNNLTFLEECGARFKYAEAYWITSCHLALKQNFEKTVANFKGQIYLGEDVDYLKAWGKDAYAKAGNEVIEELKEYLEWVETNEKE